ncbi:general transcription factor 3C polypeptide 6 [Mobula hypostoma]|uniref:general transcription factor 3C polypeptide 6 n=1 Tax=Mobula hypostoma TaxID=723540 RepID=UPI002FC3B338
MAAEVARNVQQSENGDWEEEEQLVVVELSGIIDPDFLLKCRNECKIVGIDTEQPIMQVDRLVFAGEYEDALGTCVVFEETIIPDAEVEDRQLLKYKCHTTKKLLMKRTFLSEKKEGEESTGGIEYLKIKENDFTRRPGLICTFVQNRNRSMNTGDRVISEEGLDLMMVQDKEPNITSASEGEASDLESGDTNQELNSVMEEHLGGSQAITSAALDGVMELENQSSENLIVNQVNHC